MADWNQLEKPLAEEQDTLGVVVVEGRGGGGGAPQAHMCSGNL